MKGILKSIIFESFSLYLLSILFSGVRISGGIIGIVLSGFILSILMFILRPLFGLILFPLNLITLGMLGFINTVWSSAVILYMLTLISKYVSIHEFTTTKIVIDGIHIPPLSLNIFFAFLAVSLVYSVLRKAFEWIIHE